MTETDQGYERDSWPAINTALGLTAIRIPEAYGGYGFSFGDQCIVLEEMGRALPSCAPFSSAVVMNVARIETAHTRRSLSSFIAEVGTIWMPTL